MRDFNKYIIDSGGIAINELMNSNNSPRNLFSIQHKDNPMDVKARNSEEIDPKNIIKTYGILAFLGGRYFSRSMKCKFKTNKVNVISNPEEDNKSVTIDIMVKSSFIPYT